MKKGAAAAPHIFRPLNKWRNARGWRGAAGATVLLAITAASLVLVYFAGGTHLSTLHLLYIPVLLSSYLFGFAGCIVAAAIVGFGLGPFMPLDTASGIMQPAGNWILRTLYFAGVGGTSALLFYLLDQRTAAVHQMAKRDPLTSLVHGPAIERAVTRAIAETRQAGGQLVFVAFNLRGLNALTSVMGHQPSDQYLKTIADRLRGIEKLRGYRLQTAMLGFSFVAKGSDDAMATAHRMLQTMREPAIVEGVPLRLEIAAGLAVYPTHQQDADNLRRAATAAVLAAPSPASEIEIFNPDADARQRQTFSLIQDLSAALENRQLLLHYQPKIDLRSGVCVGAEGLLRWTHPVRGAIPPAMIIAAIEYTPLMREVTGYVINTAVEQCAQWRAWKPDFVLSINISAQDLADDDLTRRIRTALAFHSVPPAMLQIEVTETAALIDRAAAQTRLRDIQNIGVSIAIDDFGTGQSSLAYLADLPFDVVKVDQVFARGLPDGHVHHTVVRSAIQLTHELGRTALVEGIETQAAADCVRELGCEQAQGYFFARPMTADAFRRWSEERAA